MDLGFPPEVLRAGLIFYFLLFASLVLRAYAQAWLADHFGDPTPRDEGRVTLYPVPHVDLLGTVVLPLICIFYLQPRIGQINFFLAWTNPVPINPSNFHNPRRDFLLTQFAGFGMSLLLASLAAVVGGLLYRLDPRTVEISENLIMLNAMLMVLDFLPVPPLPGGALLKHWGWISEEAYWAIARWSGLALMIGFNLPPVRWLIGMLVGIVQVPFLLILGLLTQ
jgi:Zn-dependent protease